MLDGVSMLFNLTSVFNKTASLGSVERSHVDKVRRMT